MGRKTVRSAAASCPRCAALIAAGTTRCGICHFDLSAPPPPAPVADEPQVDEVSAPPAEEAPVDAAAVEDATVEPAPPQNEDIDQTAPLTLPSVAVEPVAVEPVAVEPVAIEPVAIEPVAVEPTPAPAPELAPAATFATPASSPIAPGAPLAAPAHVGGRVVSTKGVRQALSIVVVLAATCLISSQLLLWFAARQVTRTFEQAFTVDSNGQFDAAAAESALNGGAFAATVAGLAAIGWFILTFATVILFLVWHAQANANARALTGRTPRFGTAPALVCWFVPFANLVIPWLNLNDIWTTTGGSSPSRRTGRGTNLVLAWWLAIAGQLVLMLVNGFPSRNTIDVAPFAPLALAQTALYIASVVLMIMTVRAIGTTQESAADRPTAAPAAPPSPFGAVPEPTPFGAAGSDRVLVAPSVPAPPTTSAPAAPSPLAQNPRMNPRDPFSWGAPPPPSSSGPTFP